MDKKMKVQDRGSKKESPAVIGTLQFVIFRDAGVWAAHGLEQNIVTHGGTLRDVKKNIETLVKGYQQLVDADTFNKIPKAPRELWDRFDAAKKAGRWLDKFLDEEDAQDSLALELKAA